MRNSIASVPKLNRTPIKTNDDKGVYVYLYVIIYTFIYIYMYICMYMYIYTYIYICMSVYIHNYTYSYIHTYKRS